MKVTVRLWQIHPDDFIKATSGNQRGRFSYSINIKDAFYIIVVVIRVTVIITNVAKASSPVHAHSKHSARKDMILSSTQIKPDLIDSKAMLWNFRDYPEKIIW